MFVCFVRVKCIHVHVCIYVSHREEPHVHVCTYINIHTRYRNALLIAFGSFPNVKLSFSLIVRLNSSALRFM